VPSNRLRRVFAAGSIAAVVLLGLIGPGTPSAGALPPKPTPPAPIKRTTHGAVLAAQSERDAAAARVGAMTARIAEKQNEVRIKNGKAEQAEQKYALAYSQLQDAKRKERKATKRVVQCEAAVATAHDQFVESVRATYTSGGVGGMTGTLLTAPDPTTVLEQSTLDSYLASHKADAIGRYQSELIGCANDKAAATRARLTKTKLEQQAEQQKVLAFAAAAQAKQEEQAYEAAMVIEQRQLNEARAVLDSTVQDRTAYLGYLNRLDDYHRKLNAYNDAKARAEAEARARAARRHHGGGGGSSGGGGSWSSGPSAPSGGGWTAEKGKRAARRALSQLGMPYAWAGGGVGGPSYGVCSSSNGAPNDCNVRGFDCSGLVMYAWGQYWDHFAANQYWQAGSYHPSVGNLRPGDLLFWSDGGPWGAIHHVAIYVGGGDMVEAPYSGGYVQREPIGEYGSIDFTTRPLT